MKGTSGGGGEPKAPAQELIAEALAEVVHIEWVPKAKRKRRHITLSFMCSSKQALPYLSLFIKTLWGIRKCSNSSEQ